MIRSFGDKETERLWLGSRTKFPPDILLRGRTQLRRIDGADRFQDLQVPPGNHLEALTGDRAGQHSIRINRQWRVCFRWSDGNAYDVEVIDYH